MLVQHNLLYVRLWLLEHRFRHCPYNIDCQFTFLPTFNDVRHHYKDYGIWNRLGLSSILTDETFGVAITPSFKREKINDRWLHGLNLTAYSFWALASIVGRVTKYISNPDMLGLDFAITAMFIF